MRLSQALMATLTTAVLLTGCGTVGAPTLPMAPQAGSVDALATTTLLNSFKHIHMAAFTKMDVNKDNQIDEYEAGGGMDLKAFTAADKSKNHKLSKKEFMDFAMGGALFGFMKQDKNAYMKQARAALADAFTKLDRDKDRLLEKSEMSNKTLAKVGVRLTIDALHVRVVLNEFDADAFTSADKTGDGKLGQAEFEDYCTTGFITGINPSYDPNPAPAPAPQPDPAVDPAPAPAGEEG